MNINFEIITARDCEHAISMLQHLQSGMAGGTAPAPAPAAAPAPAPAPAPAAMSQADFGAAVQAYAKAHGPKAAKAKLAEFGFGKTADVPAERYTEIAAHLAV